MSDSPCILYLGVPDASLVQEKKFAGVRRYAASRGWDAVSAPRPEEGLGGIPGLLRRFRPVGCVIECRGRRDRLPNRLFGPVPAVYLDSPPDPRPGGRRCVSIDNEAIARTAMRELAGWRPASVAVVEREIPSPWSSARARAFRAIAAAEGPRCHVFASRRGESVGSRVGRLARWISALPRPCGVFAVNDNTATAVLRACRAACLHIPRDIALVGVDDEAADEGPDGRPLSSIRIDFEHAGFLAAKMLAEAWAAKNARDRKGFADSAYSAAEKNSHATVGPLLVVRRNSTSGRGRHEPCMEEAMSIIRNEACDGLTARALAARFPGTRRLFDMRFREAVGHSVLDEILHVRMEKAFDLLARTDIPVGAVADFCGFGCYHALDWLFRSRRGMSAGEWRRRNKSAEFRH